MPEALAPEIARQHVAAGCDRHLRSIRYRRLHRPEQRSGSRTSACGPDDKLRLDAEASAHHADDDAGVGRGGGTIDKVAGDANDRVAPAATTAAPDERDDLPKRLVGWPERASQRQRDDTGVGVRSRRPPSLPPSENRYAKCRE